MLELFRLVLWPFAQLYALIVYLRNIGYDLGWFYIYTSTIPVISIGNLVVGGSGKTPATIWMVEQLIHSGYRPVVVSRGYGRRTNAIKIVSGDMHAREVGDEPLLMARRGFTVVVSKDRVSGAKLVEQEDLGDIIVLDDGFQHRRLNRNFNVICIDVSNDKTVKSILSGKHLPQGILRESPKIALRRVDCILFVNRSLGAVDSKKSKALKALVDLVDESGVDRYFANVRADGVRSIADREDRFLEPQPVVAFAGIAKPEGFFESLDQLGFQVQRRFKFADHQSFSTGLVEKLIKSAQQLPLICTEKDSVKIDLPQIHYLRVDLEIADNGKLITTILDKITKVEMSSARN